MSLIYYAKYFQCENDLLREDFLMYGRVLNQFGTKISYKKEDGNLIIHFENVTELKDKPIIENGVIVGRASMKEPLFSSNKKGSFLIKNYSNLKVSDRTEYSFQAFKIDKKGIFRKKPRLILNYENIRVAVSFDTLIPLSIDY